MASIMQECILNCLSDCLASSYWAAALPGDGCRFLSEARRGTQYMYPRLACVRESRPVVTLQLLAKVGCTLLADESCWKA